MIKLIGRVKQIEVAGNPLALVNPNDNTDTICHLIFSKPAEIAFAKLLGLLVEVVGNYEDPPKVDFYMIGPRFIVSSIKELHTV